MRAYRIKLIALSHDGRTYPEDSVVIPAEDDAGLAEILEQRLAAGSAELAEAGEGGGIVSATVSPALARAIDEIEGLVIDLGRRAVALIPALEAEGKPAFLALEAAMERVKATLPADIEERFDDLRFAAFKAGDEVSDGLAQAAGAAGDDGAAPKAGAAGEAAPAEPAAVASPPPSPPPPPPAAETTPKPKKGSK